MTDKDTLHAAMKPCPFCGGEAQLMLCGFGTARVTCDGCGSEGQYSRSRAEAVTVWNARHAAAELVAASAGTDLSAEPVLRELVSANQVWQALHPVHRLLEMEKGETRLQAAWKAAEAYAAAPSTSGGLTDGARKVDTPSPENVAFWHGVRWGRESVASPFPADQVQVLRGALEDYLEAQDALDNQELAGPNAEPYSVLMRRRNAARKDLDAALAATAPEALKEKDRG